MSTTGYEFKGCKFKTVRFYTTKYVLNLTRSLSQMLLRELKILTADIVCDTPITSEAVYRNRLKPTELLFILIPQLLVTDIRAVPDPGKYCIYQLEQLNDKNVTNSSSTDNETLIKTHFNPTLIALIRNSIAAFDYSSVNLDYYPESLRSKISVLPPPIYINSAIIAPVAHAYCSDILFYGSINPRRERIVTQLTQTLKQRGYSYSVRVLNRAFGDELIQYISSTRIVLNIHFYPNSILETDRIHTALQFNNVTVISEYPTQRDALLPIYETNPRMRFCEEICCCNRGDGHGDGATGGGDYNVAELAEACVKVLSLPKANNVKNNQLFEDECGLKLNALCCAEMKRSLTLAIQQK